MAAAHEIAKKLADLGLGTYNTDIFALQLPASPDVCIAVRPGGGLGPEMKFGSTGVGYETPSLQIVVRGVPYDDEGPLARAITALQELAKVEVATLSAGTGSTQALYHWIHPQQSEPFLLRRDGSDRLEYAFNVLAEKEPSVAA